MAPRLSNALLDLESASVYGLFTTDDARHAGIGSNVLFHHSTKGGRWERVLPGVYRIRDAPEDPRQPYLAAQLWAGPKAVLSHGAAAALLGLDGFASPPPELWAPRTRPPAGVIVHRGTVDRSSTVRRGPLHLTGEARTILDLNKMVDADRLELAVESALRHDPTLEGCFRDPHVGPTLRRVMRRRPPGVPPTESELETRYVQAIRLVELPPPVRQYRVLIDGRCIARLDLAWPEAEMWVELDGRATHDNRAAFYADRRRQNEIVARLAWRVLRFGWTDVVRYPLVTARKTLAVYQSRRVS